ncbi:MAG: NAD(P)/FAD-dependent oxidoreductase, partial [Planctomycetia bacterium]
MIARQGHSEQLLERQHFPRYHIGESLIPETFWVLGRLGMLDKLRESRFVNQH